MASLSVGLGPFGAAVPKKRFMMSEAGNETGFSYFYVHLSALCTTWHPPKETTRFLTHSNGSATMWPRSCLTDIDCGRCDKATLTAATWHVWRNSRPSATFHATPSTVIHHNLPKLLSSRAIRGYAKARGNVFCVCH